MKYADLGTAIGVLSVRYDLTAIVTVNELKDCLGNGCAFDARKYCDFRYATNLQRFYYDPYTGNEVDWKRVYELLTQTEA